ncbi:MAG: hypothetical protein V1918_06450 [Planctomycetota bacterium]
MSEKKTSSRSCVCLTIELCELVIDDIRTRNKSLIHIFNQINVEALPVQLRRLFVYVTLTDGRGQQDASIKIVGPMQAPEGREDLQPKELLSLHGPIEFKDPNAIVEMIFEFRDLVIPEEGKYHVEFWVGRDTLFSRPFYVKKIAKG